MARRGEMVEVGGRTVAVLAALAEPSSETVLVSREGGVIDLVVAEDCVEDWTAYILDAVGVDSGEFGCVADLDGTVVDIACPGCGNALLFTEDLEDNADVWGDSAWTSYLSCNDCQSVVFLTAAALERFVPHERQDDDEE